ncbi:hypothetical protein ACFQE0_18860 [Methylobacterium komagatae]|uniref:Uncharacterized protein n=1 Tax=Methylobacterium komagatae TaxID=374425 RepID=A0ABW2BNC7_9HYPH
MPLQLTLAAVGVLIGLPIALFGFMRLDENPGKVSVAILIIGLLITFGPIANASIAHYLATSHDGRYNAW